MNFIDINEIDQLEVWRSILGQVDVKKRFRNPRRMDNSPGAILKWYNNYLILFDPSDELHNLNCFLALQKIYNISFIEAVHKAKEIQPNFTKSTFVEEKKNTFIIKFKPRNWEAKDKAFWNVCDISVKQLLFEKCKPVKYYWTTNKEGFYIKYPAEYIYANVINNRCKLYGPKNRLFLTNFKATDIGGFSLFKEDTPFIMTMNLKSYMCLYNIGYNSRYVPSESSIKLCEYRPDYYLMDNDEAGIKYGKRLEDKYGGKAIYFDIKGTYIDAFGNKKPLSDPYDIGFKFGKLELKKQIKKLL